MLNQDNKFEILVKAGIQDGPDGDWYVTGPITSERKDLQGESVLRQAVLKGLETHRRLGRPIDWDHMSVKTGDPKWILGKGVDEFDGPVDGGGIARHVRGRIFGKKEIAKHAREHVDAGGDLFWSIGGSCERRNGTVVGTDITHLALTPYPANPDARVRLDARLAKSLGIAAGGGVEILSPELPVSTNAETAQLTETRTRRLLKRHAENDETLDKALMAGSGPGMGSTDGRALVPECLEGAPRRKPSRRKRRQETPMSKQIGLDPDTVADLEELEGDQKLGPLAKAMQFLLKSFKSKDEDEGDEDDGDEFGASDEDEDEDAPPLRRSQECEKSIQLPDGVSAVDADEFSAGLLKSVGDLVNQRVGKVLNEVRSGNRQVEELAKRLEGFEDLAKSIHASQDSDGRLPAGALIPSVTGALYKSASGQELDREQIGDLLMKGVSNGSVSPFVCAQFSCTGEIDPKVLASLTN